MHHNLSHLNDQELVKQFSSVVHKEQEAVSDVVLHLIEIDRRNLYLKEAYSNLFLYCVQKFHFSEAAAYRRIQAAKLAQKYPTILSLLKEGKVHLTTLNLIASFLKECNKDIDVESLLQKVIHKSKRDVQKILASLFPNHKDIPDTIRKLPIRNQANGSLPEQPKAPLNEKNLPKLDQPSGMPTRAQAPLSFSSRPVEAVTPVTERHVKIEFRATDRFVKKLERAKALLKHKHPRGKLEEILSETLDAFLEQKDPQRKSKKAKPRKTKKDSPSLSKTQKSLKPQKRHIPTHIKRTVYKRDGGQCSYRSSDGKRCCEKAGLEYDHIRPFALGGDHSINNVRLLCQNHNRWRAEMTFQTSTQKKKKLAADSAGGVMHWSTRAYSNAFVNQG